MKALIQMGAVAAIAAFVGGCASSEMGAGALPEPGGIAAQQASGDEDLPTSSPMPIGRPNGPVPAGFVSFCIRFQDQCTAPSGTRDSVTLTAQQWTVMSDINAHTNAAITPEEDIDHYGRAEYWNIPSDGYGDCEDYALTKRQVLVQAGFPELALRIAVVIAPDGGRHAVLTVATNRGDYVLDNLARDIRPWSQTPYVWIERQASDDPRKWVAFQDGASDTLVAATGSTSEPFAADIARSNPP